MIGITQKAVLILLVLLCAVISALFLTSCEIEIVEETLENTYVPATVFTPEATQTPVIVTVEVTRVVPVTCAPSLQDMMKENQK